MHFNPYLTTFPTFSNTSASYLDLDITQNLHTTNTDFSNNTTLHQSNNNGENIGTFSEIPYFSMSYSNPLELATFPVLPYPFAYPQMENSEVLAEPHPQLTSSNDYFENSYIPHAISTYQDSTINPLYTLLTPTIQNQNNQYTTPPSAPINYLNFEFNYLKLQDKNLIESHNEIKIDDKPSLIKYTPYTHNESSVSRSDPQIEKPVTQKKGQFKLCKARREQVRNAQGTYVKKYNKEFIKISEKIPEKEKNTILDNFQKTGIKEDILANFLNEHQKKYKSEPDRKTKNMLASRIFRAKKAYLFENYKKYLNLV